MSDVDENGGVGMSLIGGVGSGGSDTHHVTRCIHDHGTHRREGGASAVSSQAAQMQMQKQSQDAQFSLSEWLQRTLNGGKRIWRGIWGTNDTNVAGAEGDRTGGAQTMASVGDSAANGQGAVNVHTAAHNAAAMQGNPYFSEVKEKHVPAYMVPFQKARAKVVAAAEKLAGKLPGKSFRFQARNSFQAKPESRPKEDLRKRSKYRKDELVIDCILTDESYLMDSYDRNGEYSQLTTKK